MWIRNSTGHIYKCLFEGPRRTWSNPEPMSVQSPLSPQSIKRHPKTGDLLLVWNNSPDKRYPLTAAVSPDEGDLEAREGSRHDAGAYLCVYQHRISEGPRAVHVLCGTARRRSRRAMVAQTESCTARLVLPVISCA